VSHLYCFVALPLSFFLIQGRLSVSFGGTVGGRNLQNDERYSCVEASRAKPYNRYSALLLCLDRTLIEIAQILPLSRSTMSWSQHMTRSNLNTPHTILKPKTNPNPNRRHPRRRARQQALMMTPTTKASSLVPLPRKEKEKLLRRNARCLV
jgi:hypothetical protein